MKNKQTLIKRWSTTLSLVAMVTVLISCTKDFTDLNTNKNAATPESVQPSFLLTGVFNQSILDPGMHERITQLTNDVFAQYYANEGFSTQIGLTQDEWITDYWNNYHYNMLSNLNTAIRIGNKGDRAYNETQIARIWRAWVVSRATDLFGDMPYFTAANGTGDNPPYDKQEDIYIDLLKELKDAESKLLVENLPQMDGQDYVYNDGSDALDHANAVASWKRFANSLRVRLAMRVSVANSQLAKENVEEAAAGAFTADAQSCLVPRGPGFGWGYDYQYTYYYGWGAESMSRSMENLMTGLGGQAFPNPPPGFDVALPLVFDDPGLVIKTQDENSVDPNANRLKIGVPSVVDPRGPIYYNVTSSGSGAADNIKVNLAADIDHPAGAADTPRVNMLNRWRGVPAGLKPSAAGKSHYSVFNTTRLGKDFATSVAATRSYEVMTYHELCFLFAEAIERGYSVPGSSKEWYEKGIKASMAWHGVDEATATAYVASTAENTYGTTVAFDNNSGKSFKGKTVDDKMSKIITQKYLALFPDGGWEAWADHRRTGLPILIPFAGGLDSRYTKTNDLESNNYTKRITYPAIEQLNNKVFYDEAVGRQGPDLETTKIWWDAD